MDLDALTKAARLLAPPPPETVLVDNLQTTEEEFDDLAPWPYRPDAGAPPGRPAAPQTEPGEVEVEEQGEPLANDLLAQMIRTEIDNALSALEQENSSRETAMAYYYGRLPAQPAKRRSAVVSRDVADMIEAMLAQVLQAFTGQEIAHFAPASEQDEEQAEEESSYCNWVFFGDCNGSHLLYTTFKDAMQRALCVAKVYWDESTVIRFDEYHQLTEMELQQAMNPSRQGETVEVMGAEPGEPITVPPDPQMVLLAQQTGMQPPQPQQLPTWNIRLRRRHSQAKPVIAGVDCADFLWDSQHDSLYLQDVRFCAERRVLQQFQLIDMGLPEDEVEQLPTYSGSSRFAGFGELRDKHGTADAFQDVPAMNRASRPIEVFEVYYLVDRDGDGYAERVKCFFADGKILGDVEEEDQVPYALGCPFPSPHKVIGESVYDKVKPVQDVKTAMLRIAIDNALVNTFGRYEVEERMVNMNDFLAPAPGGAVRSRKIGSIAPLAMANVGDAPMNMMSYMDKVRSEGAGPALDMQKENLPVNVATAHGTERIMSAMEQLVTRIASSFADTFVAEMFRLLHRLLMKHGKGELTARMPNGQFLVTDPRNWREREKVTISIGKTQAERTRAAGALTQILQHQMALFAQGGDGVLVDLGKIHNTLVDLGRAYNLPTPDQYWLDPASPQAQQALQQKQQTAQQAAQQQQQQMQMLLQLQLQLQQMQEDSKRMKAQLDHQAKVAELLQSGVTHAEDNALKLTELEMAAKQQADAEYHQNLRTMRQAQASAQQQPTRKPQ